MRASRYRAAAAPRLPVPRALPLPSCGSPRSYTAGPPLPSCCPSLHVPRALLLPSCSSPVTVLQAPLRSGPAHTALQAPSLSAPCGGPFLLYYGPPLRTPYRGPPVALLRALPSLAVLRAPPTSRALGLA